jgi:hypothetical protein
MTDNEQTNAAQPRIPTNCHQSADGHPRCNLEARHLGSHIPIVSDAEDAAQRRRWLESQES